MQGFICRKHRTFFFFLIFFSSAARVLERTKFTVYILFNTVHVLFMGPIVTLFRKKILKMGHTVLFTHLKIILL